VTVRDCPARAMAIPRPRAASSSSRKIDSIAQRLHPPPQRLVIGKTEVLDLQGAAIFRHDPHSGSRYAAGSSNADFQRQLYSSALNAHKMLDHFREVVIYIFVHASVIQLNRHTKSRMPCSCSIPRTISAPALLPRCRRLAAALLTCDHMGGGQRPSVL